MIISVLARSNLTDTIGIVKSSAMESGEDGTYFFLFISRSRVPSGTGGGSFRLDASAGNCGHASVLGERDCREIADREWIRERNKGRPAGCV